MKKNTMKHILLMVLGTIITGTSLAQKDSVMILNPDFLWCHEVVIRTGSGFDTDNEHTRYELEKRHSTEKNFRWIFTNECVIRIDVSTKKEETFWVTSLSEVTYRDKDKEGIYLTRVYTTEDRIFIVTTNDHNYSAIINDLTEGITYRNNQAQLFLFLDTWHREHGTQLVRKRGKLKKKRKLFKTKKIKK